MKTNKDPIKLRRRLQATGNTSLYLDIYVDGKRSYEYLRLYLIPEKSRADKEKNRQTLALAEAVRGKRLVDIQNGRYGFDESYKLETNFLDYYVRLCEKHCGKAGYARSWGNWQSCLQHLRKYCRPDTTFRDVTPEWINGFKEYLDKTAKVKDRRKKITTLDATKPLSQNTKVRYFERFKSCINQAYEDRIIAHNPLRGIEGFKAEERERTYLTFDEVRAMAAGECRYPDLKRAFLFSCLTGLRKSDIEKMTWREVKQQGEFTRIIFKQKKTGWQEYLDISPEAVPFMGERKDDDALVFEGFHYSAYVIVELRAWAMRSGVNKYITFHTGRHTFAVLMLDLGAEIYTVQKLLGHKNITTTQIYANIMDKRKQEAVAMIPHVLRPEDSAETDDKT